MVNGGPAIETIEMTDQSSETSVKADQNGFLLLE